MRYLPDPILREQAKKLGKARLNIKKFTDDMIETMGKARLNIKKFTDARLRRCTLSRESVWPPTKLGLCRRSRWFNSQSGKRQWY